MATPTPVVFPAVASGAHCLGGRVAPAVTGLLGEAVAAMASGTMQKYLGTNINEMTVNPLDGLTYGIMECGTANSRITPWASKISYDPVRGVISGIGTSEGNAGFVPAGGRSKEIIFDAPTNTFTPLWNPTGKNEGHMYDCNVSRPMNGYVYRLGYNMAPIGRRATSSQLWDPAWFTTTSPISGLQVKSIEVFPDMGAAGALCIFGEAGQVWTIDIATNALTTRTPVAGTARYSVSCYIESAQCVVFGGGELGASKLYKMDKTGAITEIVHALPAGMIICCSGEPAAAGGPFVPHPGGKASIIAISEQTNAVMEMTLAGVWTKLADFPVGFVGRAKECCAAALHGLSAIALFWAHGRTSGVTTSEFWICKV